MCGIAGSLNIPTNREKIESMLYHRGPNDKGFLEEMSLGGILNLFHSRLSIQDLSTSASQPMHYKHLSIIFNGEIYNHLHLREGLKFDFKTHSDTETILALYDNYGSEFLNMLDGMFAFVIYDRLSHTLFMARDRMGKKPFFFYKENDKFAFASELNTLLSITKLELELDNIAFFLKSGFFYHDGTPYKHTHSIPNGYYGIYDLKSYVLEFHQYFDLARYYEMDKINDENEVIENCESILKESIKNRLVSSDIEVGAFLSGGIDSSLIVAIASNLKPNLKTFTISFEDSYDESHLAQLTANKYNTDHKIIKISTNLKDDIETILQNYGRPFFDSSAIPSYYVAKEAKKHLSVILTGDGADELFGGYRRYVGHLLMPKVSYLAPISKFLPKPSKKASFYTYFYRLMEMAKYYDKNPSQYYLKSTTDIFDMNLSSNMLEKFSNEVEDIFNSNLTPLSKMLLLDSKNILLSDLLPKMDIATMAHSLEARSPFLSKMFVEFAPRINDDLKIRGRETKYILRILAQKYLPKEIFNAPKRGFEVPLKKWVNKDLKDNILDSLTNPKISNNFLSQGEILSLCNNTQNYGEEKRAKMLWNLYALEVWYKGYISQ